MKYCCNLGCQLTPKLASSQSRNYVLLGRCVIPQSIQQRLIFSFCKCPAASIIHPEHWNVVWGHGDIGSLHAATPNLFGLKPTYSPFIDLSIVGDSASWFSIHEDQCCLIWICPMLSSEGTGKFKARIAMGTQVAVEEWNATKEGTVTSGDFASLAIHAVMAWSYDMNPSLYDLVK